MRRSPSYGDLVHPANGETRGFHNEFHYGAGAGNAINGPPPPQGYAPTTSNYRPNNIPGQWPASPPPQQQVTQPPPQWAPPASTLMTQPSGTSRPLLNPQNNWAPQDDFLDMPEPSTTPIPPAPLPARKQENQHW